MMIDDEYIKSKFSFLIDGNKRYSLTTLEKEYLSNRFNDARSHTEALYRILYNVLEKQKCPVCGRPVKWHYSNNYFQTCGTKQCKDRQSGMRSRISVCANHDGVHVLSKNSPIRKQIEDAWESKYGVRTTALVPEIRDKQTQTLINHYGVDCNLKAKECQDSIKMTCINRYGVDHYSKSKNFKEQYKKFALEKIKKDYDTKKKNGTFNTSRLEEDSYALLCDRFGKYDIIRQYKSELYPWNCDFYIKSIDTYIEIQGNWTHGFHVYGTHNEDNQKLEYWKSKKDINPYYKTAIHIWTTSDPLKRQTAKDNKLNYLEFWNLEELQIWINNHGK